MACEIQPPLIFVDRDETGSCIRTLWWTESLSCRYYKSCNISNLCQWKYRWLFVCVCLCLFCRYPHPGHIPSRHDSDAWQCSSLVLPYLLRVRNYQRATVARKIKKSMLYHFYRRFSLFYQVKTIRRMFNYNKNSRFWLVLSTTYFSPNWSARN